MSQNDKLYLDVCCLNRPFDHPLLKRATRYINNLNVAISNPVTWLMFVFQSEGDSNMETIKLRSHIGINGILQIQMPTDLKNTSVEVVVVLQPLPSEETQPQYNAWGKLTTKESMTEAVTQIQQLGKTVGLDKNSIREMIEEGRRF